MMVFDIALHTFHHARSHWQNRIPTPLTTKPWTPKVAYMNLVVLRDYSTITSYRRPFSFADLDEGLQADARKHALDAMSDDDTAPEVDRERQAERKVPHTRLPLW